MCNHFKGKNKKNRDAYPLTKLGAGEGFQVPEAATGHAANQFLHK